MGRAFRRYKSAFLALLICAAIALGAGSVQGLVSLASSLQSSEEIPGIPFPADFSADQVQSDYTISTGEELVNFAAASKKYSFAGVTIHLAGDVDYSDGYLVQNDSYPIADRQSKVMDLIDTCVDSGVGVMGLQEVTKVWYDYIANYVNNVNPNLTWSGYGRYGGTFGGFGSGTNDNGDAFCLILFDKTKYTKIDEGHFWLSDTPDEKSLFYTVASNYRVVNWVRLRDKTTGEDFFFVNAHLEQTQSTAVTNSWGYTLDASSGVTARIQQAQLICDRMAAVSEGLPVIILGDWNSYTGTDGYSTIISAGYQDLRNIAPDAEQCGGFNAWSRTDPARLSKGDHVVVSEGSIGLSCLVWDEEDVDAATGYHISDHCPLIAVIRY